MAGNRVPIDYTVPAFPSLYITNIEEASYLYYTKDIWRFTLYWTFIFYGAAHALVAVCALVMQARSWRLVWALPLIYLAIGALEALFAGSIVGLLLGSVYEAGNFRMSTWLPMVWAGVNVMVLVVSTFPMQGGL